MAKRINKLEDGYEAGSPNNLPIVDFAMVLDFIQSSAKNCLETQGWKLSHSCRENYGDNAIGYVQVRRTKQAVSVKARITPEYKIRQSAYIVSAEIDEENQVIKAAQCHDCIASEGDCKHTIAFIMWLNRRSETPSTTSTECYWKKSILSTVIDPDKSLKISEIRPTIPVVVASNLAEKVLESFISKKPKDCQLYLHHSHDDNKKGSIHSLAYSYLRNSRRNNAEGFLKYVEKFLDDDICLEIEEKTRKQSKNPYLFEMKYGRISASKIYEVSRCETTDGSLVSRILGSSKFKGNFGTRRGIRLEEAVLKQLEIEQKQKFQNSGFFVNKKYPFFGVSPDGISDTHVVEIKCPTKLATITDYISEDGDVDPKCFAQVQTQMYLANKRKAFFVVADPAFESNSKINFECYIL